MLTGNHMFVQKNVDDTGVEAREDCQSQSEAVSESLHGDFSLVHAIIYDRKATVRSNGSNHQSMQEELQVHCWTHRHDKE